MRKTTRQARRKRRAGGASAPPPYNLLKFVAFVSEKDCKSQDRRMKIQTRIYSRKLPESIQNAMSFDVIQVKNFKIFMERSLLVISRDPLPPLMAHFQK